MPGLKTGSFLGKESDGAGFILVLMLLEFRTKHQLYDSFWAYASPDWVLLVHEPIEMTLFF